MLNILGEDEGDSGIKHAKALLDKAYSVPGKNFEDFMHKMHIQFVR